jgi:hypothetical protein
MRESSSPSTCSAYIFIHIVNATIHCPRLYVVRHLSYTQRLRFSINYHFFLRQTKKRERRDKIGR